MLRQRGNIQKLEFLNGKCRNCVRAWLKLGDLLTCDNNFCVNKRQLLPISRFAAKMQYILPLRSYNMRLKLQGDVSH